MGVTVPKIALNMIVKNEAGSIKRCLDSVRHVIDYWVICDTGSTDHTQDIIRRELKDIPGELHQDQWVNFSHNRNLALQRARGKGDYHLLLDADFTANIHSDFKAAELNADAYLIKFTGEVDWRVLRLVSDRHAWAYHGVAHEYIKADTAQNIQPLDSITVTHHEDGGCRPGRFEKYLELLLAGASEEPENSRYVFYIAQTYKDTNRPKEALEWYHRRIAMDGWEEETWYSVYQAARCKQLIGVSWPEVLSDYLTAYQLRPWRLEPLLPICQVYRNLHQYHLAHLMSRVALEARYPDDHLFIERPVYEYALLMEHAIACYWVGQHEKAVELNERLLAMPNLPPHYQVSAVRNRLLSLDAMGNDQRETLKLANG